MNRLPGLFLLFSSVFFQTYLLHAQIKPFPAIPFPLNWKVKIGMASFRTNVVLDSNQIIIGSNGNNFMDRNLHDHESGVYLLNRKTGRIEQHVAGEKYGDMDVNGVLLYHGRLFFGNDNEEFLCTDKKGLVIWRNPTSGDIEHEPSLLDIRGKKALVYASEAGEVRAVSPLNGKTIWTYLSPEFNGWLPGDNRSLFKIKAYFSNTQSFFTKPLLLDLNRDSVKDLVYHTYNNKILAINGKNGKLLWKKESGMVIHSPSAVLPLTEKTRILSFGERMDKENNSLQYVYTVDEHGKTQSRKVYSKNIFGFGLNSLQLNDGKTILSSIHELLIVDSSLSVVKINRRLNYKDKNYAGDSTIYFRNTSNPLLANRNFTFRNQPNCIAVLNQHDYANYEMAFLEIISLNRKKIIGRWSLPSGSEMPPFIDDINKDGFLDLLVSGYDGYLYCYNMQIAK